MASRQSHTGGLGRNPSGGADRPRCAGRGSPTPAALSLIAATEGGEACICDLTGPVALTQPTVSHHMKLLVDAGLVSREQRGKWAYYRVVRGALESLASALAPSPAR